MKKIAILTLAGLLTISCGNKTDKKANKAQTSVETAAKIEKKTQAPKVVNNNNVATTSILLLSDDQMKFDKKELRVKAGTKITLTLKHTGKMAKNVMGHNFVLLKDGVNLGKFAMKAITATKTAYIPEDNSTIAYTKLIGGGESTTITFDAPAIGTYDFLCSFPGHYAMMKGKFIVE